MKSPNLFLALMVLAIPLACSLHAQDSQLQVKPERRTDVEGKLSRRALFGAQLAPVTPAVRAKQKLEGEGGVVLQRVFPGTSAAAGDFKINDVILAVEGVAITGVPMFIKTMAQARAGQELTFEFVRDGAKHKKAVRLKELPREAGQGYDVIYSHVTSHGARLRTIITRPRAEGRHVAVFLLQGGNACFSIDTPVGQPNSFTRIARDLARAGYVTMRLERPGCGDSEGGPLRDVDFNTELDGFKAALKALKRFDYVDADNVFLFGHSMGGVVAPLMAGQTPVRGIAFYGTASETWFESVFGQRRRLLSLSGMDPAAVDREVLRHGQFWFSLVVHKKTPTQILDQHPGLRKQFGTTIGDLFTPMITDRDYVAGRHYTYYQQLADRNLPEAWEKLAATPLAAGKNDNAKALPQHRHPRVLAIWGKADWMSTKPANAWVAHVVNRVRPGSAKFVELDSIDHFFFHAESFEESFGYLRPPRGGPHGRFNPAILRTLRAWLGETATSSKQQPATG